MLTLALSLQNILQTKNFPDSVTRKVTSIETSCRGTSVETNFNSHKRRHGEFSRYAMLPRWTRFVDEGGPEPLLKAAGAPSVHRITEMMCMACEQLESEKKSIFAVYPQLVAESENMVSMHFQLYKV